MKGIFCGKCFTVRSLPAQALKPVRCDCGNLSGWWIDPVAGTARYHAKDRTTGFMIGWNNRYFFGIVVDHLANTNEEARKLHDFCTDTPGYIFDKGKRACWSVILWPGTTSDTAWATPKEAEEAKAFEVEDIKQRLVTAYTQKDDVAFDAALKELPAP